MSKTLYTFGYLSQRVERIIADLMAYDGRHYIHIPELGNEHYRQALSGDFQEQRIKLHDPLKGFARLERILNAYQRVAIFCACASKKTCHRVLVAEIAHQRFGVEVIHL